MFKPIMLTVYQLLHKNKICNALEEHQNVNSVTLKKMKIASVFGKVGR